MKATMVLVMMVVGAVAVTRGTASAASCERLALLGLPHTAIATATLVPAGPFQPPGTPAPPPVMLPAHCRVAATLTPSSDSTIEMEVWMPADNWNGKFEAVGNGGWAGVITYAGPQAIPRNMAFALAEGYATASTDTGHVNDGTQGRFAAGHPEKLTDFAYRAVHEMTVASKAIITAFYGNGPRLSYWNGCSTGGRQALIEAQRFPPQPHTSRIRDNPATCRPTSCGFSMTASCVHATRSMVCATACCRTPLAAASMCSNWPARAPTPRRA